MCFCVLKLSLHETIFARRHKSQVLWYSPIWTNWLIYLFIVSPIALLFGRHRLLQSWKCFFFCHFIAMFWRANYIKYAKGWYKNCIKIPTYLAPAFINITFLMSKLHKILRLRTHLQITESNYTKKWKEIIIAKCS